MSKKENSKEEVKENEVIDPKREKEIFRNLLVFMDRSEARGMNENAAFGACVHYLQSKLKN